MVALGLGHALADSCIKSIEKFMHENQQEDQNQDHAVFGHGASHKRELASKGDMNDRLTRIKIMINDLVAFLKVAAFAATKESQMESLMFRARNTIQQMIDEIAQYDQQQRDLIEGKNSDKGGSLTELFEQLDEQTAELKRLMQRYQQNQQSADYTLAELQQMKEKLDEEINSVLDELMTHLDHLEKVHGDENLSAKELADKMLGRRSSQDDTPKQTPLQNAPQPKPQPKPEQDRGINREQDDMQWRPQAMDLLFSKLRRLMQDRQYIDQQINPESLYSMIDTVKAKLQASYGSNDANVEKLINAFNIAIGLSGQNQQRYSDLSSGLFGSFNAINEETIKEVNNINQYNSPRPGMR